MAKKRANGEGNIRKRKDGRWEGRYTAGYDSKTGKRLIKNVLGKTQAEVKEKLKKALEETNGLDVSKAADEYRPVRQNLWVVWVFVWVFPIVPFSAKIRMPQKSFQNKRKAPKPFSLSA